MNMRESCVRCMLNYIPYFYVNLRETSAQRETSGHKESIDNFIKFGLLKTESKRGAVWDWGVSNSGKTTKLRMYSEIFNVVNYTQTRSKFDLN